MSSAANASVQSLSSRVGSWWRRLGQRVCKPLRRRAGHLATLALAGVASSSLLLPSTATANFDSFSWTLSQRGLAGGEEFAPGANLELLAPAAVGGSGSVTSSLMTVVGGNASVRGVTFFEATATVSGVVSIDWSFVNSPGNDIEGWDAGGFVVGGVFTALAINAQSPASGTVSLEVQAGGAFGFGTATADGLFGASTTTFTNLQFTPAPVSTCPADFDGNEQVDGADLGTMLAGWGQPGITDLDDNGTTDGADLGALLAAWGACPKPSPTVFTGVVVLSDGTPVADAVVVTNLGGTAATGKGGDYELSLMLDSPPASVTLTAVASIGETSYQGSAVVGKVVLGDLNEVDPIVVSPQASCSGGYAWLPGFGTPGMNDSVLALTVFDDGTGPALYAGGWFTAAGGVSANRIARWNGTAWSALGSGRDNTVRALTVFDDGTGPALYAGGDFTTAGGVSAASIARWDGTAWSPLGSGILGSVYALTVFDDGTGPALYAGGDFIAAGGVPGASRIARWNGTEWSPLGSGMNNAVSALTVFDDGTGPALHAGGSFTIAGGSANRIAKWDGTAWSALGSGMSGTVLALTVFDDGTGPALYAGGVFTTAGGVSASRIARWNGTEWSPLGSGMNNAVSALTVFDDGTGPALHAGGSFTIAGGSANRIAKWDGTAWSALGSGMNGGIFTAVSALTVFDDGTGPALYAGGQFTTAGGVSANNIAKWGCVD